MSSVWTEAVELLLQRYGRAMQPFGDTVLERAITTVVRSRGTAAAEKLLQSLRDADALTVDALAEMGPDELSAILPKGTATGTARRLREFARLVVRDHDGSIEQLFEADFEELRAALRQVNGLGPETIDTLLLSAGNIPILPVTSSLHRVAKRHGWIDVDADSETISAEIGTRMFETADEYWQLHALVEQVGKEYCGKTPRCNACPLVSLLPEGGVVEGIAH